MSANVESSPPSIALKWPVDPFGPSGYTVYRKSKNAGSWNMLANLPGNATGYVDNSVAAGATYEYQVVKAGSGYTGYGYIYAGIKAPLVDGRGKVILIVDSAVADNLSAELARLKRDLIGDGWMVLRHDVNRADNPANVKALIRADYNADPGNVEAVFLFGHVPIFRCGNLNVDGHQSRPMPADTYYGDMDGAWGNPDYLPSDVELMVGRVDLWNMPGNGAPSPWGSEVQMLRNYLDKDHKWRHKQIPVPPRALLGNRFGDFNGEAFAASGFRNFDALAGPGRISIANEQDNAPADQRWSSLLGAGIYLWAYGCGGGSYTSMSGMGTHGQYDDVWSTDIVGENARAVFFMMFGSWLGEWDSADNLMRSVLATPSMGLTCSWAGRPHWFYHHMGLGEPIGHSARVTMNNSGLYRNQVNHFARGVHIALMGDPTLRMHPVAPPANLNASMGSEGAVLSWTASADSVSGYHVYRAATAAGPFARLTSSLLGATRYTDANVTSGTHTYMVRAIKLESGPSGTYFNPSQGVFVTVNGSSGGGSGNPPPVFVSKVWFEDRLPASAIGYSEGGDGWRWVSSPRYSGAFAHRSNLTNGLHQHYFNWATATLNVKAGDRLFAYVYLDPAHPPKQVMLQWNDGTWEHRAYWGRSLITYGVEGTASRRRMGSLPVTGKWAKLQVPAGLLGLEGRTVTGMAFTLFGGRATWDRAGKLVRQN